MRVMNFFTRLVATLFSRRSTESIMSDFNKTIKKLERRSGYLAESQARNRMKIKGLETANLLLSDEERRASTVRANLESIVSLTR